MDGYYAEKIGSHSQKEKKLSTFLIALFIAAAMFVPYIIAGKGYFIFYGDFNVQQIPFYKMCHAAIKSGNFSWTFGTDLGADFIGSYSFYLLGSPFFWITLLFPNFFVPYLMGPLLILKFACAAFTAYLYIRRFTKTSAAAQLGALLYAFSGFSVYNIFFNHFHEVIVVFPLLLLALESLYFDNRRGVFCLAVALCAVINYYFFFGMAVFTLIYFFIRILMQDGIKISRFFAAVFEAVLGVLIAAFLLLPSLAAIMGNGRISNFLLGWNAILYGKEQIYLNVIQTFFFPPDLPARPVFFPSANVKWSSLGGWLPVFGMTGVITWFVVKPKTWIKRLLIICIFMALVPILNASFSAFNSAYYARWFYMPILIMCLATALIAEDKTADMSKGFKWSAAITATLALVIGLFPQLDKEGKLIFGLYTQSDDGMYFTRFWITVLISVISLVVLGALIHLLKDDRRLFIRGVTATVVIISILYGAVFIGLGRSHSYEIESVMIDSLIEGKVNLEGDKDTFRIDTYECADNTGMYLGYNSMNAFHSIVPSSIMKFYEYVGITRDVASRANTEYPALRPLFSVKYLLNLKGETSFLNKDGTTKMPGFEYIKTSGGHYVYENKNYIPYGFSYDYAMTEDFLKTYDGKAKTRLMLKAMLLSKQDAVKYADYIGNISTAQTQELEASASLNISPEPIRTENSPMSLSLTDEEMALDCRRLAKTGATSFKVTKDGFTAQVTRNKKSLVFFSVPYDSGFTAYVNGKQTEIINANVGFMAVPVEAGNSVIEFIYETPMLNVGLLITGGALIVFAAYFIISFFVISGGEKKAKRKEALPDVEFDFDGGNEEIEIKSILDGLDSETKKPPQKKNGGFTINEDDFD